MKAGKIEITGEQIRDKFGFPEGWKVEQIRANADRWGNAKSFVITFSGDGLDEMVGEKVPDLPPEYQLLVK